MYFITIYYRLLGEEYNSSSDIWSVGLMLIQLWIKNYPFERSCATPVELLAELESTDFRRMLTKCNCSNFMVDFICSMLNYEPKQRMSAADLLSHNWFKIFHMDSLNHATEILHNWIQFNLMRKNNSQYDEKNRK